MIHNKARDGGIAPVPGFALNRRGVLPRGPDSKWIAAGSGVRGTWALRTDLGQAMDRCPCRSSADLQRESRPRTTYSRRKTGAEVRQTTFHVFVTIPLQNQGGGIEFADPSAC